MNNYKLRINRNLIIQTIFKVNQDYIQIIYKFIIQIFILQLEKLILVNSNK